MSASFAVDLRSRTAGLWEAMHAHPFVVGMGEGTLSRERFQFYLEQDYVYLMEFSRVLAVATAKAEKLEDMRRLAALLSVTLDEEMELHRRTCSQWGIAPAELERVEPAMITTAYTSFLLRTCFECSFGEIVAVLLPCAAGYVEIAEKLREKGLPETPHYRDWIRTYTSPEMKELVLWLSHCLDSLTEGMGPAGRARCERLYRTSAQFELLFFEMAWERRAWPACIPPRGRGISVS